MLYVRCSFIVDGSNFFTRAVSANTHIQLEAKIKLREKSSLLTNRHVPEPCIFPVLRWFFSIIAGSVLIFVMVIFIYMFYDMLRK